MIDPLVESMRSKLIEMYGSDPKKSDSYGRIVNRRHCERLIGYLENETVAHGGQHSLDECFLEPTIVVNPDLESPLMQEEIFGPILPIFTVESFEQAVSFVTSRDKPLAAYLFSNNKQQQDDWVLQVSSGNQGINETFLFQAVSELPFGGVGQSGMGQYSGKHGFDLFSHKKSVIKRPNIADLSLRFAPYNESKFKHLRWLR